MNTKVRAALKDYFKPEFLNQIDEVIVFHPLAAEQIRSIVDKQIAIVATRLLRQKITLVVSAEAKDWLAQKGFDPNLGARPLKRVIQTELLDPLAMKIVAGVVSEGQTVNVGVEKEKLVIK